MYRFVDAQRYRETLHTVTSESFQVIHQDTTGNNPNAKFCFFLLKESILGYGVDYCENIRDISLKHYTAHVKPGKCNFNAVVLSCKHLQSSALPRGIDFMDTALSGVSLPPPLLAAVQRSY